MHIADAVAARWQTVVERTGAPAATGLAAVMVAVTALQYVVLPAVGVPANGPLQHRLFYFDTGHPIRAWTPATSAVAHGGFLHPAVNVQLVLGFGSIVEPRDGSRQFATAFAAGAAGALVAALLLQVAAGNATAYVGASGGPFGLLGWLAGRDPGRRLPTIPPGPAWMVATFVAAVSILLVAVYGVSAFGIAHVSHLGGLGAGAGVGLLSR